MGNLHLRWINRCQQTYAIWQNQNLTHEEVATLQNRHRTRVCVDITIWTYLVNNPSVMQKAKSGKLGYNRVLQLAREARDLRHQFLKKLKKKMSQYNLTKSGLTRSGLTRIFEIDWAIGNARILALEYDRSSPSVLIIETDIGAFGIFADVQRRKAATIAALHFIWSNWPRTKVETL